MSRRTSSLWAAGSVYFSFKCNICFRPLSTEFRYVEISRCFVSCPHFHVNIHLACLRSNSSDNKGHHKEGGGYQTPMQWIDCRGSGQSEFPNITSESIYLTTGISLHNLSNSLRKISTRPRRKAITTTVSIRRHAISTRTLGQYHSLAAPMRRLSRSLSAESLDLSIVIAQRSGESANGFDTIIIRVNESSFPHATIFPQVSRTYESVPREVVATWCWIKIRQFAIDQHHQMFDPLKCSRVILVVEKWWRVFGWDEFANRSFCEPAHESHSEKQTEMSTKI